MEAGRNRDARAACVVTCEESLAFRMKAMAYLAAMLRDVDVGTCGDKRLEYAVSDLLLDGLELVRRDDCLDCVATDFFFVLVSLTQPLPAQCNPTL